MIYYLPSDILHNQMSPSVSCIGYFDGVHLGHQKLINKAVSLAKEKGVRSSLITFDPDPASLFNDVEHINTNAERYDLFGELGIDDIYIIRFDLSISRMSPSSFVDDILAHLNLDTLICGFDFHFGYKGSGDHRLLKELCPFPIICIDPVEYGGEKISSSRIRLAIEKGDIYLINQLLGYPYHKICLHDDQKFILPVKDMAILPDGTYLVIVDHKKLICIKKNNSLLFNETFQTGSYKVEFLHE